MKNIRVIYLLAMGLLAGVEGIGLNISNPFATVGGTKNVLRQRGGSALELNAKWVEVDNGKITIAGKTFQIFRQVINGKEVLDSEKYVISEKGKTIKTEVQGYAGWRALPSKGLPLTTKFFEKLHLKKNYYAPDESRSALVPISMVWGFNKDVPYRLVFDESTNQVIDYKVELISETGTVVAEVPNRYPQNGTQILPLSNAATTFFSKTNDLGVYEKTNGAVKLIGRNVAIKGASPIPLTGTYTTVTEKDVDIAELSAYIFAEQIHLITQKYVDLKGKWRHKIKVNLRSHCNAFFNPLTNSLNFFSAGSITGKDGASLDCNNTATIADVVYHEWGHSLDDYFGGIDDGAGSEGWADVVSLVVTGSPEMGPYFFTNGGSVRNMREIVTYPCKDFDGNACEVHHEGKVIGGAFYAFYEELKQQYGDDNRAKDVLRKLFFSHMPITRKYTDSYAKLNDIDSEAYGSGHHCQLNRAFATRNLAQLEEGCKVK